MSQNDIAAEAGDIETPPLDDQGLPDVVDHVAVARLYGEPLFSLPNDLYIPPDALEVFLETFEGPLDLLLYLIRKQKLAVSTSPSTSQLLPNTWVDTPIALPDAGVAATPPDATVPLTRLNEKSAPHCNCSVIGC